MTSWLSLIVFVRSLERVPHDDIFLDGHSADQMFLNYSLEYFRRAGVVPDAFGVDQRRGTALTYLKTVRLCPVDPAFARQIQLLKSPLQVFPRLEALFFLRTPRLCLIATKKDVTVNSWDPNDS